MSSRFADVKPGDDIWIFPSYLKKWLFCQHQFELQYVEDVAEQKQNWYFVLGNCVDKAAEEILLAVQQGTNLSKDEVLTHVAATYDFETTQKGEVKPSRGLDAEYVRKVVDELALFYWRKIAPTVRPEYMQQRFELKLPGEGIVLACKPDLVEEDGYSRDLKTSEKRKQDQWLDRIQATFAVLCATHGAPRKPCNGFQFDFLLYGGREPAHDPRVINVTQTMIDFVIDNSRRMAHSIRTRSYGRTGDGKRLCSNDWCDFWDKCIGSDAPHPFNDPRAA